MSMRWPRPVCSRWNSAAAKAKVGGLRPARAVLAEGGKRGVDQPRIDGREGLVAEPQHLERSGPIILDEDVGGGGELLEDIAIRRLLQIQRDRALVGGLRQERRAHVAAVERLVGAVAAALIGLVGMLDFDHVGAEHGQLIGGKRPRQNVRDVDDSDSFKRSHDRALLVRVRSSPRKRGPSAWPWIPACAGTNGVSSATFIG